MKILVVSHACVTAVLQSFYADLERELGWTVTLVTPARWRTPYRAGERVPDERWPGFAGRIRRVDVLRPGDIPAHVYRTSFLGLLREERPDVIYMHQEPYGLSTFQVYLANWIVGWRPIGFYAAQNILKRFPWPLRVLERAVFRASSFAFPVTGSALEVLRVKGYRGLAEVLPLALDAGVYHASEEWEKERRRELGIGPERFVVGYVGRLVEEKGLAVLLNALERMDRPWDLVLVGAGPFEVELRRRAAELPEGRVHFVGYVPHDEAPRWMGMFDVLALLSETRANWKEQFGRVLLEAIACGTPVLGSDAGEIPHVIRETGGGLVVPEGDVERTAEALRELANSVELRLGLVETGQAAVLRLYDQRALVRRFAAVIELAMGRS